MRIVVPVLVLLADVSIDQLGTKIVTVLVEAVAAQEPPDILAANPSNDPDTRTGRLGTPPGTPGGSDQVHGSRNI